MCLALNETLSVDSGLISMKSKRNIYLDGLILLFKIGYNKISNINKKSIMKIKIIL